MGAFEDQHGKVDAKIFKEDLQSNFGAERSEVIQGPSFGVDTAVIDLEDGKGLAISSDPLSLIPSMGMEVSAWLSVHLLANDMCTTGFPPQYAQFVLNLPTSLARSDFNSYWWHIHQLCEEHGIAITGGHTGQVPGLDSTISGGGTMFLTAPKSQILTTKGARAGDTVIMTRSAALSSTSLLARAFPKTVANILGQNIQQKAADNFWQLSVLRESAIAMETLEANVTLHAMHDVTEGGILGALNEMAMASNLGFEVHADAIPVYDEVQKVADLFEIDPLLSIGSGSMLMAVAPEVGTLLIDSLKTANISATAIGTLTKQKEQLITMSGEKLPFGFDGTDPYWAAFFRAFSAGWQ
ncbi:AIR synthase family protein [Muricauda sp. SCSIO 64092]|uniref:AIR synthase family protein n=1 Tax=Allomuricauda sp. SCSIO 64092 TaxID=2908842 RepID=UPI001FF30735|nr:AIR synthase family protein [Muricauda sp. SCSIO 64092]UOY08088.1 AIR synthase family protein [Muricauda sp. SCSIO 64092]